MPEGHSMTRRSSSVASPSPKWTIRLFCPLKVFCAETSRSCARSAAADRRGADLGADRGAVRVDAGQRAPSASGCRSPCRSGTASGRRPGTVDVQVEVAVVVVVARRGAAVGHALGQRRCVRLVKRAVAVVRVVAVGWPPSFVTKQSRSPSLSKSPQTDESERVASVTIAPVVIAVKLPPSLR